MSLLTISILETLAQAYVRDTLKQFVLQRNSHIAPPAMSTQPIQPKGMQHHFRCIPLELIV
jgi:hypothetical protein